MPGEDLLRKRGGIPAVSPKSPITWRRPMQFPIVTDLLSMNGVLKGATPRNKGLYVDIFAYPFAKITKDS